MQIAIGLPKFLLEAENAVPALIVAFLFILIVIPFLFFVWYNKSLKSDDLRCLQESFQIYQALINENLTFSQIIKIISMTKIFDQYKFKSGDEAKFLYELGQQNFGEDCPKPPERLKNG